jgi:hypothetical protein
VWSSVNKLKHLTPLQQFSYIGHIRFWPVGAVDRILEEFGICSNSNVGCGLFLKF